MGNIMINEKCNLKCPYCFASEFTLDKITKNMSLEDFKYALDFTVSSGGGRVGVIGGEPTLHPQFKEIMEILINDDRVNQIVLFTNGTHLEKHIGVLSHWKVAMLVNYNCEEDIGKKNFEKINRNLDLLINEYYMGGKVNLGINMYKPGFEYKYMLDALKKYNKTTVRTSISMPMDIRELDHLEHMGTMKESVFEFFRELEKIGVAPRYDCNLMPVCMTTEDEKAWLNSFKKIDCENNLNDNSMCSPVIDITVDMVAVRCFALSAETKADIRQFKNIEELNLFYFNQIDSYKCNIYASDKCKECSLAIKGMCTGGCLAYKMRKIEKARNIIHTMQMEG